MIALTTKLTRNCAMRPTKPASGVVEILTQRLDRQRQQTGERRQADEQQEMPPVQGEGAVQQLSKRQGRSTVSGRVSRHLREPHPREGDGRARRFAIDRRRAIA